MSEKVNVYEILGGQIKYLDEWSRECSDTKEIIDCADAIIRLARARRVEKYMNSMLEHKKEGEEV